MRTSTYNILKKKIENIKGSIQINVSEINTEDFGTLSNSEKSKLLSIIESIDSEFFEELRSNINDCEDDSEYWDFQHSGGKDVQVYLQFEYSEEDEDTVTYQYTIDGGGVVNTIDISKEDIIEQLKKGNEIEDIILTEIECNSF
jgi:hypothetical protein